MHGQILTLLTVSVLYSYGFWGALISILKNIALNIIYLFLIWPCHGAYGILVPRPRIEPVTSSVKAWSPNHWTSREFPKYYFSFFILLMLISPDTSFNFQ